MINIQVLIPLIVQLKDLQIGSWFVIVQSLAVNVLLGATYIGIFILGILFIEQNVVPDQSAKLPVWEEILRPTRPWYCSAKHL